MAAIKRQVTFKIQSVGISKSGRIRIEILNPQVPERLPIF
jgi:hypothetical protein